MKNHRNEQTAELPKGTWARKSLWRWHDMGILKAIAEEWTAAGEQWWRWHKWYAWRPVRTQRGTAWGEYVERCAIHVSTGAEGHNSFIYRKLEETPE